MPEGSTLKADGTKETHGHFDGTLAEFLVTGLIHAGFGFSTENPWVFTIQAEQPLSAQGKVRAKASMAVPG
jgi:hypothetical protein